METVTQAAGVQHRSRDQTGSGTDARRPENPIVFYDGECGLCDRVVSFLTARDKKQRLRFAALQSETARALLPPHRIANLDTVVLVNEKGTHIESSAVLRALVEIGQLWTLAGALFLVGPHDHQIHQEPVRSLPASRTAEHGVFMAAVIASGGHVFNHAGGVFVVGQTPEKKVVGNRHVDHSLNAELLAMIYRGITRRCIVCRNSMEDDGVIPTSTHRQNGECPAKVLWDTFGVPIVTKAWRSRT